MTNCIKTVKPLTHFYTVIAIFINIALYKMFQDTKLPKIILKKSFILSSKIIRSFYCTKLYYRGQKSLKPSNSMTWSDQNCPTKGAYFAIIFLLKQGVKFSYIFINSYLIYFGYNTAYIADYEELLFSLDQNVTQLNKTLSLKMSSRSKINCGHGGQLNTVEYAVSSHRKARHPLSNHLTVFIQLSDGWTAQVQLSNYPLF